MMEVININGKTKKFEKIKKTLQIFNIFGYNRGERGPQRCRQSTLSVDCPRGDIIPKDWEGAIGKSVEGLTP
jgi:hypothetical protein